MTDEQNKRLAQLKNALDLGAIDQDTYDVAVAALSVLGDERDFDEMTATTMPSPSTK